MKKLQLLTLITLFSAATYSNQAYAWTWPFKRSSATQTKGNVYTGTITQIDGNGTTTINGCTYTGPVTIINGKVISPANQTIITDSGKQETKKMNIADVREIDASGFGNLTIEQCKTCSEILTITADENIMPLLKHEVHNKTLELGFKDNVMLQTNTPVNYHAVVKDINKISTSGSMDIKSKGTLETDTLTIKQSGSGDIHASVNINNLNINKSGSGNTTLSGTTQTQTATLSGSGKYNVNELSSSNAKIRLSGSGQAIIHVINKLRYAVSGSGNLIYRDNPKDVQGSKSGSGKVKKA
jgi:hypothetical protein